MTDTMKFISLFSGIGGFDLGLERAGWECVAQVEIDEWCQKVLTKHWPNVPRFKDVKNFSSWMFGDNVETCYNQVCSQKNKDNITNSEKVNELIASAKIAGNTCPFLQALLIEVGDSAHLNVDTPTCAVKMEQMQMVGFGCEEVETPTGKAGLVKNEKKYTEAQKLQDGEDVSSQEMGIPAKSADCTQRKKASCKHTTSKHGQTIQKKDLTLIMDKLYANNAIKNCTKKTGTIDAIVGGVPCQPASVAGKRKGKDDDRWLWGETFRIVREFRPTWCIFENVPGLLSLEGGLVYDSLLSELEDQNYEIVTLNLPAVAFDAPHRRERLWIVAHADSNNRRTNEGKPHTGADWRHVTSGSRADVADTKRNGRNQMVKPISTGAQRERTASETTNSSITRGGTWWSVEPPVGRVAHGIPRRVDRLRGLGNAVVPVIAQYIGEIISEHSKKTGA